MTAIKLPPNLATAYWSKQVGNAEKPAKMTGLLDALRKGLEALPFDLLEVDDLRSLDAASQRLADLSGRYDKAAKAVSLQTAAVQTLADSCADKFKRDSANAKTAYPAAVAVSKAASTLGSDVLDASSPARARLKPLIAKLEAEAKKDSSKKDEEEADALANEKDEKAFREKLKALIKATLKKIKGEGAPPAKFRAVNLGKTWGVYTGRGNGEAEKKMAVRLAGVKSGFKDCKGIVYWSPADKVYIFEGANVPTGGANSSALARCLKDLIGFRPKLRLQKPGERGEDSEEGEPDPDDLPLDAGKGAPPNPAVVEFTERLRGMAAAIKAGMDKATADQARKIKGFTDDAAKLIKANQPKMALGLLDQLSTTLKEIAAGAKGGGAASMVPLDQARAVWATARQSAVKEIGQLANQLEADYASVADQLAAAKKAANRLRELSKALRPDLEALLAGAIKEGSDARRQDLLKGARKAATQVRQLLDGNDLVPELDHNEVMPGMAVVAPMREGLKRVEAALA